jgi:hypothetical protein
MSVFAATWVLIFCAFVPSARAQAPVHDQTGRLGLGVQAAPFPILGLSIVHNPSSRLGLQLFAKTGFDVDVLAARGLYRFGQGRRHNWYASALFGYFRDPDVSRTPLDDADESDSAPGFGAGIGLEHFFDSTGRFGFNLELDFIHIAFDDIWWEYEYKSPSLVMLGAGFHYYL